MPKQNLLRYTDTDDRLYGIAGMTIGLLVYDADQYIDHLDGNSSDLRAVELTPDFFVYHNQQLSAKGVWKALLDRHKIMSAMVMGNILSRAAMGSRHAVDPQTLSQAIDLLAEQADDMLGLTPDENRRLVMQSYDYVSRAFLHPLVIDFVNHLHSALMHQPAMSRGDLFDLLAPLR
ncbi:MAG: hypothetical protein K2G64_03695 [Muribaculaceae bacterium]|nr:hypothetical protein [Muribaculaceae bacterium]